MFSEVNPLKIIVRVVFKFDSVLLLASSISFKIYIFYIFDIWMDGYI